MAIHPHAAVDRGAEIDPSAEVGAYAIIESGVQIGPEAKIFPHAYVSQGTTVGRGCQIHPFAVVGHPPQDLAWDGAPSYTTVGDGAIIREGATIHRGTMPESTTVVGNRVYLMANSHVGHNCVVADNVILANGALLGGHVHVGARAFIGGNTGIHQFVHVGELAILGGVLRVVTDVPPFMLAGPAGVEAANVIGLRRAGFSNEERMEIREAYRTLYRSGLLFRDAVARVAKTVKTDPGRRLVDFLQRPSKRGFMGCRKRRRGAEDAE